MAATREFDVVVAGEINVDLILTGETVRPEFGREKLVADATLTMGSSSVIFACGAARLGLRVAFVGKVGKDAFGDFMLRGMQERGVDIQAVYRVDEPKTGITVSLSEPRDRAMLTYAGAIAELRADEVLDQHLSSARHLHVSSAFLQRRLLPDLEGLFARAHRLGCTTSLDTGWDPEEQWDGAVTRALAGADVFMPNEEEAPRIAGTDSPEEALAVLAERVPLVAIKLGRRGAIAATGNERAACESYPVRVVDTTGAGDSFNAGLVYGFLHHWSLQRSLQLGCACGALSARAAGGTAAQPTLEEALTLIGQASASANLARATETEEPRGGDRAE
ncbi:MAG: carbohydrate kinase family protein [Anaerolineae bacterium]|nr:carbohydrate kinase family protein [Anaerolineae bacterium]